MLTVTAFYTPISGYAYLGAARVTRLTREAGVRLLHRPVDIAQVFEAAGTVAPARQSEARRRWRSLDMARWAQRHHLPLNPAPAHWPTPAALASRAIIAAQALGGDVDMLSEALLRAVWAEDRNIAEAPVVADIAQQCGLDADQVLVLAQSESVGAAFEANTRDAIAAGVIGSPTYLLGDQMFYGQDRLDFLAEALLAHERLLTGLGMAA